MYCKITRLCCGAWVYMEGKNAFKSQISTLGSGNFVVSNRYVQSNLREEDVRGQIKFRGWFVQAKTIRPIAIAEVRSTIVHRRRQIQNTPCNSCNKWDIAYYIDTFGLFLAPHFAVGSKGTELTGAVFSRRTITNRTMVLHLQTYRKRNVNKGHSSAF